jgi:hypothetical protein
MSVWVGGTVAGWVPDCGVGGGYRVATSICSRAALADGLTR